MASVVARLECALIGASTASHPSISALAAFALGKLDAQTAEAVHKHLAGCSDCRTVVETTPHDTLMGLLKKAGAGAGDTPSLAASVLLGTLPLPNPDFDIAALPVELRDHPRYHILRKLGEGGMGAVYEAEHTIMDRVVAIKVIAAALVDSPEAVERFQREVRAAARLEHANIVRAYDADQAGGTMLLAMEFVKGRTLADVIAAKGPLPVAYACRCVRQAALGLQHAADHQMVHRDIKPQNLMLTEEGVVKILDFGLAKLVSERATRAGLTAKDMVRGTPEYMAPEQARDTASADVRADIYALGCTLFCLLTGRPPFVGGTAIEVITKHLMDIPPRVTDSRPEVPAALADLIDRMLAKNPADRPQSPTEVAEALRPFTKPAAKTASRPFVAVEKAPFAGMATAPVSRRQTRPAARGPPRWPLPAAAAIGVLLTAIISAIVVWVATPAGYVRLEVAPDDAEVLVDGEALTVKPYRITVDAKERKLVVRKEGFVSRTESISIRDKGKTIVATLVAVPPVRKVAAVEQVAMKPAHVPPMPAPAPPEPEPPPAKAHPESPKAAATPPPVSPVPLPMLPPKVPPPPARPLQPGTAFAGRSGPNRQNLILEGGGSGASEAAVANGLKYLQRVQKIGGNWVLDGGDRDDAAATGLALLPFLAAGHTHKPTNGAQGAYARTVQVGLDYLRSKQKANGSFGCPQLYGEAIATLALCEAFGVTQDPALKRSAQKGIDYLLKAQHSVGGFRYRPLQAGDTSVTGWCLQALESGYLAGLYVPGPAFSKVGIYLDRVQTQSGAAYGYVGPGATATMTAVGLLCREYLGWGPGNSSLAAGVENLKKGPPSKGQTNIYYYYYATQVMHSFGGEDWADWNLGAKTTDGNRGQGMREILVDTQDNTTSPNNGSWAPGNDQTSRGGGRLTVTCLSLLTLEVYYRHMSPP